MGRAGDHLSKSGLLRHHADPPVFAPGQKYHIKSLPIMTAASLPVFCSLKEEKNSAHHISRSSS
jgi:hypothetical protein